MKKFNPLPALVHVLLVSLVLAWAAAGCARETPIFPTSEPQAPSTNPILPEPCPEAGIDGKNIPFETLVQGYRLSSPQSVPALYLAVDTAGVDALSSVVDSRQQALLGEVKLDSHAVLAAVWGVRPSGGESITICSVSIADTVLTIGVILQENAPDMPKVDVATYPYHLVLVSRPDLPEGSLHYRLVSAAGLLAEGDTP